MGSYFKRGLLLVTIFLILCSTITLAEYQLDSEERILRQDSPNTEFSNIGLTVGTYEQGGTNYLAYSIAKFSFDNVHFDVDEIEKAELVIEVLDGAANPLEVDINRITEDWTRATFGSIPEYAPPLNSITLKNPNNYNVDITELVIDWINNNNNYGVLIKESNENINKISNREIEVRLKLTFVGCSGCPDVNNDNTIDISDLSIVATKLFSGDIAYDLNGDARVRLGDLFCVGRNFGNNRDKIDACQSVNHEENMEISISTTQDSYNIGDRIELTRPSRDYDQNLITGNVITSQPSKVSDISRFQEFSTITNNNLNELGIEIPHEVQNTEDLQKFNLLNNLLNPSTSQVNFHGYIIQFKEEPIVKKSIELELKANKNENSILNPIYSALTTILPKSLEPTLQSNIEDKKELYEGTLTKQHDKYIEDISNKVNKDKNKITGLSIKSSEIDNIFLNDYTNLFNGVVVQLSPEEIEKIKELNFVKEIYPNNEVHISLSDSIPLIEADQIWQLDRNLNDCTSSGEECLTGKDITIAILDTGVDYTHPDLRGKVIDQYCYCEAISRNRLHCCPNNLAFQEGDNAAMDDNGHGTHVAATAAGNGILKGVAPDANIIAIKVLASSGSGLLSDIISGIERAIDPNNDGDYSDRVDIISMSLGLPFGMNNDPVSQAVDNAIELGTVAVIAAGNSGPRERTIGSPGTSKKAITVGASLNNNHYARLSNLNLNNLIQARSTITDIFMGNSRTPTNEPYDSIPVKNSILTLEEGISGSLIDGGLGLYNDFISEDFNGKIVLMRINDQISTDEQIENAYQAGSIGAIFYQVSSKSEIPFISFTTPSTIPAISVSDNDAESLILTIDFFSPIMNMVIFEDDLTIDSKPPSNSNLQPNTPVTSEIISAGLGFPKNFNQEDYTNKIALIERGEITFSEKIRNAYENQARGVIVYNNEEGSFRPFLTEEAPIPLIFINQQEGELLLNLINSDIVVAEISFNIEPDRITSFSSRGPTLSGDVKPDILAPGNQICAAQSSQDKNWDSHNERSGIDIHCLDEKHISISGTSMATPHISGVIALLKQKNPDWSPDEIKMALRNTAVDINEPANIQGYGRVDTYEAIRLENPPPIAELVTSGNVFGNINIIGSATGRNFYKYSVSYGIGDNPTEWIDIITDSTNQVINDLLTTFDISSLQPNTYMLRLTVEDTIGQISEDRSNIIIDNSFISNPGELDYYFHISKDIISIKGTAAGNNFNNYKLEYSQITFDPHIIMGDAEIEGEWHEIQNSATPIIDNILGEWDSSLFADGLYKIRLTTTANQVEKQDEVYLYANNVYISSPSHSAEVNEIVEIIGRAQGTEFNNYVVEYSRDDKLDIPTQIISSNDQVDDGILATFDTNNLEDEHYYKITLRVNFDSKQVVENLWVYKGWRYKTQFRTISSVAISDLDPNYEGKEFIIPTKGSSRPGYFQSIHSDGTWMEGWPVITNRRVSPSSPAIADINNDGIKNIIMTSEDKIYVFNPDGTIIDGWPFEMPTTQSENWGVQGACPVEKIQERMFWSSPTIYDINNDGNKDIIVGTTILRNYCEIINGESFYRSSQRMGGRLHAFNHDGSTLEGWPIDIGSPIDVSPTVYDIDNDGYPEIITGAGDQYARDGNIYVFNYDGSVKFRIQLYNNYYMGASPTIVDLDGDGAVEIIAALTLSDGIGDIFVFDSNGNVRDDLNWPIRYIGGRSSPAIGNIDNDEELEIIIGSDNGALPQDIGKGSLVYAFNHDGSLVDGWPTKYKGDVSSPIIGNIDSDNEQEIIIGSSNGEAGLVYAFNHDGSRVENWPRATIDDSFVKYGVGATPALSDIDNDGLTEVITSSRDGNVYIWNTEGVYNPQNIQWPMLYHDLQRTSTYVKTVDCNPGQTIGDINGDGFISEEDSSIVLKMAVGEIDHPNNLCCVDLNSDGRIKSVDAIMIDKISEGQMTSPGICKGLPVKSVEKPPSQITNNNNQQITGNLLLKIDKNIDGNWNEHHIVFDDETNIPANNILDLSEIWNQASFIADETGLFRVYVNFNNNELTIENSWQFEITN